MVKQEEVAREHGYRVELWDDASYVITEYGCPVTRVYSSFREAVAAMESLIAMDRLLAD